MIPTPNRQRMSLKRDRKSDTGFDSSDEEAQANDDIADLSYIHLEDTSYSERLLNMHARFTELLNFIIAGLHDIHRSAGEPWWEALADSCHWDQKARKMEDEWLTYPRVFQASDCR